MRNRESRDFFHFKMYYFSYYNFLKNQDRPHTTDLISPWVYFELKKHAKAFQPKSTVRKWQNGVNRILLSSY